MNKKSNGILIGSLVLILLISTGVGAIVGATTKKNPDYLNFYINNQIYEPPKKTLLKNLSSNWDDLSKSQQAELIVNKFLTLAITGSEKIGETSNEKYNYILNPIVSDWNIPYLLKNGTVDINQLEDYFISIEFYRNTLDQKPYEYLMNFENPSDNLQDVIDQWETEFPGGETIDITLYDLINNHSDYFKKILDALKNDTSYQRIILDEMMTYAYLWQKSNSNKYDYNLTKELVYDKPSIYSAIGLSPGTSSGIEDISLTFNNLANRTTTNIDSTEWNDLWNIDDWTGKNNVSITDLSKLENKTPIGSDGFNGFSGIRFGTGGDANVKPDYIDFNNIWDIDPNTGVTSEGDYSNKNVLTNGNLYKASRDNGYGVVVGGVEKADYTDNSYKVTTDSTAEVIEFSQLLPYEFADSNNGVLTNYSYSLFTNIDSGKYTKGDENNKDEYIFDRWFGLNSIQGEIFLITEMISNDSELKDRAEHFFKDKGFYIDLSGSYENDYSSLIPDIFLK